jgi:hypothetical protein
MEGRPLPQKWAKFYGSYINILSDAIFVQSRRVNSCRMLPGPTGNANGGILRGILKSARKYQDIGCFVVLIEVLSFALMFSDYG